MKKKKTVRALIIGRLGNQMFQYANALQYSKKYNANLKLIFCGIDNQLKNFNIDNVECFEEYSGELIPLYQKIVLKVYNIIRKIYAKNDRKLQQILDDRFKRVLGFFGIIYNTVGYLNYPFIKRNNILLVGYFESPKYFESLDNYIKDLYLNIKINNKVDSICKEASNCNSVAISIRRGDFVEFGTVVCNKKYYEESLKVIKEKVKDAKYYIFSDDVEWVKSNMDFPEDSFYESEDLSLYDIMKIRSSCRHFILANSTFSWWGAYLSDYHDKVIIAPKYWRFSGAKIDLVNENWITIDNSVGDK